MLYLMNVWLDYVILMLYLINACHLRQTKLNFKLSAKNNLFMAIMSNYKCELQFADKFQEVNTFWIAIKFNFDVGSF